MSDHDPAAEDSPPRPAGPPCRSLRSNGSYIFSSGATNPNEGCDTSIYWCLHTMKGFGPDDDLVNLAECRDPARSCHEPL